MEFHQLVTEAKREDAWDKPTRGTRWTNEQLLFHMLFGYMIVQRLVVLVKVFSRLPDAVSRAYARLLRNRQYLWIGEFHATSDPADSASVVDCSGVMSMGRSSSLPLWKTAPARTRATRCGALTARQRACAASISL